jgi:predicted nucleotidyltransferase
MRFGGQLVSRLTLFGGDGGSLNTVDLIETRSERYSRGVLKRAVESELRAQNIRIVSPEDFVVLKILATRERDLEDAASVLRSLSGGLDLSLIEAEISALAIEITDYEVLGRWRRAQGWHGNSF